MNTTTKTSFQGRVPKEMINDSQTNKVYLAEGLAQYAEPYAELQQALSDADVQVGTLPRTSSKLHIWARDYMPIQIGPEEFVSYIYSPDYLDEYPEYIPDIPGIYQDLNLQPRHCPLVMDGGNVVKCGDKVILTDKILKENPMFSEARILRMLEEYLQAQPVLIPWDTQEEYGHADGMVRFIELGRVLLTNYLDFDKKLRERILEKLKPHFEVEELHYGTAKNYSKSWAYINFLQTEGHIFFPQLGIPQDERALMQISEIFPTTKIHPILHCEKILKDGGLLNCTTWNIQAKH